MKEGWGSGSPFTKYKEFWRQGVIDYSDEDLLSKKPFYNLFHNVFISMVMWLGLSSFHVCFLVEFNKIGVNYTVQMVFLTFVAILVTNALNNLSSLFNYWPKIKKNYKNTLYEENIALFGERYNLQQEIIKENRKIYILMSDKYEVLDMPKITVNMYDYDSDDENHNNAIHRSGDSEYSFYSGEDKWFLGEDLYFDSEFNTSENLDILSEDDIKNYPSSQQKSIFNFFQNIVNPVEISDSLNSSTDLEFDDLDGELDSLIKEYKNLKVDYMVENIVEKPNDMVEKPNDDDCIIESIFENSE